MIIREMSELHSQAFPKLPQKAVTNRSGECSGLIELLAWLSFFPASLYTRSQERVAKSYFAEAKLSGGALRKYDSERAFI